MAKRIDPSLGDSFNPSIGAGPLASDFTTPSVDLGSGYLGSSGSSTLGSGGTDVQDLLASLPPGTKGSDPGTGLIGEIAHAVGSIPGVHEAGHLIGQTATDFENAAINLLPGLYHYGGMIIHHPLEAAVAIPEGYYRDFRHPLRHPGNDILDLLALYGGGGAVGGRVADIGATVARDGALPSELTQAAREGAQGAQGGARFKVASSGETTDVTDPLQYAESLGKGDTYTRIIDPLTGEPKSVSRQVWDTLLHGPPNEERILTTPHGAQYAGWDFSKNPAIKLAQKQIDRMYAHWGDAPPFWHHFVPGLMRTQEQRINAAQKAIQTIERNTGRQSVAVYLKKWGDVSDTDSMAMRMLAELTLPAKLLKLHKDMLASGDLTPEQQAETAARMDMIREAAKYIKTRQITLTSGGRKMKVKVPTLDEANAPAHLAELVHDSRLLSNEQQGALNAVGPLPEENMVRRLIANFHLTHFGELPINPGALEHEYNSIKGLRNVDERKQELAAQLEEAKRAYDMEALSHPDNALNYAEMKELIEKAQPFYVPYKGKAPPRFSFGSTRFRRANKMTSKPTTPSRLTHLYQADLLKLGGGRTDVTKLLAENYTEGMKYVTLLKHYNTMLAGSRDTPEGIPVGHRKLIRDLQNLPTGVMPREKAAAYAEVRDQLLNGMAPTSPEAIVAHGRLFEGIRNWIFPEESEVATMLRGLYGDVKGFFDPEHGQYRPIPGYKWVDDRQLGWIDKQNPLWSSFEHPLTRRLIRTADVINTIQKDMLLYLKPAYAFPNAFGNLFLNLVQQGFMAPFNLAKSFRIFNGLKKETIEKIRTVMGGGFNETLKDNTFTGIVHDTSNWIASRYGNVVDDPFRFSAFLHEARLSGFRTSEELEKLLNDPKYAPTVERVARRANEEILNYERMGPGEQAILRRLVFFYPWLKASGRYSNYFLKNHPVAAGLLGQVSQIGEEHNKNVLGDLPAFEEGLIPYAKLSPTRALVGSGTSSAILQEPADLAKMIQNVLQAHPNLDISAFSNLAPVDAGFLAALTSGKVSTLAHPASEPVWEVALNEMFGGNPLFGNKSSLIEQLTGGPSPPNSLFPDNSAWHALLKFFATGGLTPRVYNIPEGNALAAKGANATGYVGG